VNSLDRWLTYLRQVYCSCTLNVKSKKNGKWDMSHIVEEPRSFSLYYNDLARWLFITLTFNGLLATGWFGIPLTPTYFITNQVDIVAAILTLMSALGTIWGAMGYRELTRSAERVLSARYKAKQLDPQIGDYQYRSYNPETKQYESGYLPLGPIDFWDKETKAPSWLDKGKYWHILLGLQSKDREIIIQVVRDSELPFLTGRRNVAVTVRERIASLSSHQGKRAYFRYRVKVPQWLVMSTERSRYIDSREFQSLEGQEVRAKITDLNKALVSASEEVIEREKPRIKYPYLLTSLGIYLNKSLPLRIIYEELSRYLPRSKKNFLNDINKNLANAKNEELIAAITQVASNRGIPPNSIRKIRTLMSFLKSAYDHQGLGEGSTEYHNLHHSLEVSNMVLQMLPREFHGFLFKEKDYEVMLVAALLHDYDPVQSAFITTGANDNGAPVSAKGPKVTRTINELRRTRIHEAYFALNPTEFEEYVRVRSHSQKIPAEFSKTHPEYLQPEATAYERPMESLVVEALIWRTEFPYSTSKDAQTALSNLLKDLSAVGYDSEKINLLAEILWLADLSVTYMSSDPIRAWDRVTSLYDELYLPKFEAVSRTDAFFADFAETKLFKELLRSKTFPDIFRQRWNLVYQFFHEGNPSTQLNRTISDAKKLFLKVNVQLVMMSGEMLEQVAIDNWAEYFIGISENQQEVLRAKNRFATLDPPNASAFWGSTPKLIPNVVNKVVDNFIIILPKNTLDQTNDPSQSISFKALLSLMKHKLRDEGTIQILTNMKDYTEHQSEISHALNDSGFDIITDEKYKIYFPSKWQGSQLNDNKKVIVLRSRNGS
jgi:tRNA G46 methylase TrmB